MTSYSEFEKSFELGMPVELYDISYSGNTWHFTTNVEPVTIGTVTYKPIPIERGETEQNSDAKKANIEIKISTDTELADIFKITPPSDPVTITVRQYHAMAGVSYADLQTAVIWKGRIINVSWEDRKMVLTSESVFSSLLRVGNTRKYSRQCTHTLYGNGCTLDREKFSVKAVALKLVGTTINIPHGKEANWFAGGYLTYRNAQTGSTERRAIISSTKVTVTVAAFPLGVQEGVTEMTLYAGCNHTINQCDKKFNNNENYGGQPYIPIHKPFGGSSIY